MNAHCYRLVLNRARGMLMAVAETAVAHGNAPGSTAGETAKVRQKASLDGDRQALACLRPAAFAALLACGAQLAVVPLASAQIVAYKPAPASQRPTVLSAGNGVPLVNIQTPSAAGVSRNIYEQFDVQTPGAILNNSRTNVQTQLGGWVQGNPWLAAGSARIILNEVVSANSSQLLGYVEVAGSAAQVVIANPAGVTCSGCGFINASRATLTTGKPIMNGGNLDGYRVEGGTIRIDGAGMDASGAGYTDLIARAIEVNAGLWAQTLKITAGANVVAADHSQANPITPAAGSGAAPAFAIDVAQLGGMYAGKIVLVGTETGVGVRNAGHIGASAGEVVVTADGRLTNSGSIMASGNITVVTPAEVDNSGLVSAGGTLALTAATVSNADTLGADLGLEGNALTINANHIDNHNGALRTDTELTVTSAGTLDNRDGLISALQEVTLRDQGAVKALAISNTAGTIIAGQTLSIDAASVSGDGQLLSHGDLAVKVVADFTHTGEFTANNRATFETAGTLNNAATMQAGTSLALTAATIDNLAAGEILAPELRLAATAANTFTNRGLIDGGDTRLDAITLNNLGTGRIYGDHLAISAATLNNLDEAGNSPVIAARSRLDLGVSTLNNRNDNPATADIATTRIFSIGDLAIGGSLDANNQATGAATLVHNHGATIEALGNVAIAAADIKNTNAGLVTGTVVEGSHLIQEVQPEGWSQRLDVMYFPTIFNYGIEGQRYVVDGVVLGGFEDYTFYQYTATTTATQVTSSRPGQILAGGNIDLVGNLENNDSRIVAGGTLMQRGGSLVNVSTQGTRTTTYSGWAQFRDWDGDDEELDFGPAVGFSPAPTVTSFNLGIARFDANTAPAGSGTTVAALTVGGIGQSATGGGSLFRPAPDSATYVMESDPQFANYRQWLSSDYMLNALSADPATTQKRLGDGFYEQRLITEQIAQLTGRRFLAGYQNDEEQYRALMDAGVTVARDWQLVPGVALTAEQMAQLTSDIVWLVEKEVKLANGSVQKVMVPQLYARVRDGDLAPSGALLVAEAVDISVSGDAKNLGTIAGRQLVSLSADNVRNLGGRVAGQEVLLTAIRDIEMRGGGLEAGSRLDLAAGRNIDIASTTQASENKEGGGEFSRTNLDRVAALYVKDAGGSLKIAATGNVALLAAQLASTGGTRIDAGGKLTLGTVTTEEKNHTGGKGYRNESGSRSEVGTRIDAAGDIALVTGDSLTARAADVTSQTGALLARGKDIVLEAGEASSYSDISQQKKQSGFLSSKTKSQRDAFEDTTTVASTFSGENVTLIADRDITVKGGNVAATSDATLIAGRDIRIEAATETHSETHEKSTKQSGLFGSGGFGVTIGSRQNSTDQKTDGTTAAKSTIGSVEGNVTLVAGEQYRQLGSDVIAVKGDIDIAAKMVDIVEARETSRSVTETRSKQGGFTLAITSPVITAIQTAQQMSQAAKDTSDPRMKALAAASTGLAGYNAANSVADTGTVTGGVNLVLSLGGSKSSSQTTQTSDMAAASNLAAGRDIRIEASGGGKDSDITLQGAKASAARNLTLAAEDEIKLLAAVNTADQKSKNQNTSGSIGISIGTNTGFTVGATAGRGKADGDDLTHTNTRVEAGETLTLQSGGDTTMKGAVAKGERVIADVGNNLKIESLQDTSTYDSKQKSLGGSITVGVGVSGNVSASSSKVKSNYASVTEQSAIRAGDEGFDVEVEGDTDLKGGAITSTQQAVEENKNRFEIGGQLTLSDIQNKAEYTAKSVSVNVGAGFKADGSLAPGGTSAGFGKDGDKAESMTLAAISGVAGNKDARTGDAETGIAKIFDQEKVQKEIEAQTKITQMFGQLASKAVGDYAQTKTNEATALREQAKNEPDDVRASQLRAQADEIDSQWGANGSLRLAAHTVIGGLTGGASGAAGAAAGTLTAPLVAEALAEVGVDANLGKVITALASTAAGAAVGGTAGASTALNEVANNYLSHAEADALGRAKERRRQCKDKACADAADAEITQWETEDKRRNVALAAACTDLTSAACKTEIANVNDVAASYASRPDGWDAFGVVARERAEANTLSSQYHIATSQAGAAVRLLGNLALDLTPLLGDAKAIAEANTKFEYALAMVGVLGPVGDGAKALIKEAKVLLEAGDTAAAAAKMAEAETKLASGVYDAKAFRDYYDAKYGAENVTSTTIANTSTQRINSNTDKGITVTSNASGRAVEVVYKDPVTGQISKANVPYDSRGLPVFDDVSKYTTAIDMTVPYEKQFKQATLDLREAINTGKVDAGQFTAAQLSDIQRGADRIKGYTWHHNAQSAPNNMQLIPIDVHKSVSHLGQGALSQGK